MKQRCSIGGVSKISAAKRGGGISEKAW